MLGHTFYHESIKRYVIVFGTLFNDIIVKKRDPSANNSVVKELKVPIAYGPAEKFLVRADADKGLSKAVAIELPRMAFEITGMQYAGDRKLPTTNRYTVPDPDNAGRYKTIWQPVPYDLNIQLNIMVKSYDDGCAILEQILPFFTPDWTPSVQLLDDPQVRHDIPFVLVGISNSDQYESGFTERRQLIWTLDFIVKGFFFGPTTNKKVIKISNTNIHSALTANSAAVRINIKPGMTANGEPTTDPDQSIPAVDIDVDDDWNYIVQVEDDI
jgi:hypothetical protein